MAAKRPRRRRQRQVLEVNLEELDGIVDAATEHPISQTDASKLKTAMHAMAQQIAPESRSSEKTAEVVPNQTPQDSVEAVEDKKAKPRAPGRGRNGAADYTGAARVDVKHPDLQPGAACPECQKGKVYPRKDRRQLVRVTGGPPLKAPVYDRERYRCNLCGQLFDAPAPEGVGEEKYDETVASAIAQLK